MEILCPMRTRFPLLEVLCVWILCDYHLREGWWSMASAGTGHCWGLLPPTHET